MIMRYVVGNINRLYNCHGIPLSLDESRGVCTVYPVEYAYDRMVVKSMLKCATLVANNEQIIHGLLITVIFLIR